jgi:tetratricopeptide (TPR) repeat protein
MLQTYRQWKNEKGSRKVFVILLAAVAAMIVASIGVAIFPEKFPRVSFFVMRVKNTASFLIMGEPPRFYYLDIEKNGRDLCLGAADSFDLSYRDEFVVKDVSSDAIFGRGITVDVQGVGKENDYRILLRGIDLIDHIVQTEKNISEVKDKAQYRIMVIYRSKVIAAIPIRVAITPQDWLRYARSTESRKLQIEYLKRAIAMNNKDGIVLKMLAGVYTRAGMPGEAIVQYRNALEMNPDDLTALIELSKCYINTKEYGKVIETCRKILRINPSDVSALTNMALAYSNLGQWEKAIASYRELIRLNPDNPLGRFKLGEAYEKMNRTTEALEQYRIVLAKVPNALHVMYTLAGAALKAGKYDESIKWYTEVAKRQPRNASVWANLGLAYGAKGIWKEEVENYRKSLTLNPGDPVVRFNLGVAYEKGKRDQEAASEYAKVLTIKPNDLDTLQRLADMDMRAKRYEQATRRYERMLLVSTQKAQTYASLGFAYGELNKHKEAAENYKKAIKNGAKYPQLHFNLAYTYAQLGKTKEAMVEYEKYASLHPTAEVLDILADYYMKEKRYDSAVKSYKKMIELAPPGKASVYASLGYVYGLKGDTDREIEYYKLSLHRDPEDDEVYQSLGAAYEKKEMFADAYKAYVKAYELNPEADKAKAKIPRMKIRMLEQKYRQ